MIKVTNVSVMNFENAIRGMRNPLNSWDRSDSDFSCRDCEGCYYGGLTNEVLEDDGSVTHWCNHQPIRLGGNDLSLAMKLANAGSDDRKFLRQIIVSMDITAPFYWWKEFDTYKVGTVANSCSTMHRIHSKEITREDFSCDRMTDEALKCLDSVIEFLEGERVKYNETKEKEHWHNIIQLLPTSYNQMRTVTLNYEVLRNMYHARKHHKLQEWVDLTKVIETLPYSCLITGER